MAYINFSEGPFGSVLGGGIAAAAIAGPPAASFSPLEARVIALAERDHLGSLREPGRIGTMIGRLFGGRGEPRLANPRLEALRRLAVLAWHRGYNVPRSELAAFFDAGFSPDQAESVIDRVVGRRAARRARRVA